MREVKVTASSECPMVAVRVGVNGTPSNWLVDSGARESVLDSESFRESHPGVALQPLPEDIRFSTTDGSSLNVLGSFVTDFWFRDTPVQARVFVCKGVTRTRLIGGNILSKFPQWGVDNKRRCLVLGDMRIPLVAASGEPPRTCEVQLSQQVKVPPRCSKLISASLPQRCRPSEFIFKPDQRMFDRHKLLVPVCLVANDYFDGTVSVKVTNPSYAEVTVNKGTKVGKLVNNVEDYDFVHSDPGGRKIDISMVQTGSVLERERVLKEHEELYKLYVESKELLSESEADQLLGLLCRYMHVFSRDDNDIGTTDVITHKIIPKSDKVVYRRQYRHSEAQHKQIDEEVRRSRSCWTLE